MKNFRSFPIASLAVAGVFAGALTWSSVQAQDVTPASGMAGTWLQTITLQGKTPFDSLITFHSDGTVTDTSQADTVPPELASPGHGVWQYTSTTSVHFKLVKFLSVATTGASAGDQITDATLTLTDSNEFKATGVVAVYYNGKETSKLSLTSVGIRMTLTGSLGPDN